MNTNRMIQNQKVYIDDLRELVPKKNDCETVIIWAMTAPEEPIMFAGLENNDPWRAHAEEKLIRTDGAFVQDLSEFIKIAQNQPDEKFIIYLLVNRMPCGPGSHKISSGGGCVYCLETLGNILRELSPNIELVLEVRGLYGRDSDSYLDLISIARVHIAILKDASIEIRYLGDDHSITVDLAEEEKRINRRIELRNALKPRNRRKIKH